MDWIYKALLTAAGVALLLAAARLLGRRVAGILTGLPTVTGPALAWLALAHGTDYAAQAAVGSVAACGMCALFALGYDRASRRHGVVASLVAAVLASALVAVPLQWLSRGLLLVLPLAVLLSVLVHAALPDADETAPLPRRRRGELLLTSLVSGAVSGAVALLAPAVGPFWAGVLASPPLIAAALAMHQHAVATHASVRCFLRGYVVGLIGRVAFGAGFALLLAPAGVTAASLLAAGAGCLCSLAAVRLHAARPRTA